MITLIPHRYAVTSLQALRSATRFKALDETALFGCACCHEFPMSFINLKHGERFGFPVQ